MVERLWCLRGLTFADSGLQEWSSMAGLSSGEMPGLEPGFRPVLPVRCSPAVGRAGLVRPSGAA